eukprot:COSAG02_NODE_1490_length_12364_cov_67.758418_6_plen_83_part_00
MHYSLVADSQQVEMLVFTREQFTRMEREQPAIAEKIMTHVMEKVRLRFVVVPGSILNFIMCRGSLSVPHTCHCCRCLRRLSG